MYIYSFSIYIYICVYIEIEAKEKDRGEFLLSFSFYPSPPPLPPRGRNVGVDVGEVSLQGRRASTDPTGRIVNRDQPRDSWATLIDTSIRLSIIRQPSNFAYRVFRIERKREREKEREKSTIFLLSLPKNLSKWPIVQLSQHFRNEVV